MTSVAVFDIDGVLADVAHRLHYLESHPKRWGSFFAAAGKDGLLSEGASLARSLATEAEIRYLTGRPERLRQVTQSWLDRFDLPAGPLTMRPNRDRRPARTFKRDRLAEWLGDGAEIAIVVDDDPAVVAMIEQMGLPVLSAQWQHTPVDEQQLLWDVQERLGRS